MWADVTLFPQLHHWSCDFDKPLVQTLFEKLCVSWILHLATPLKFVYVHEGQAGETICQKETF